MSNTGLQGPLHFAKSKLPFDRIPLLMANCFQEDRSGVAVGRSAMYYGPTAAGTSAGWVLTDSGGTGAVSVDSVGRLVVTTAASADEQNSQLQFKNRAFRYSATRKLVCFARLKASVVATTDLLFGLVASDTTLISASAVANTDGIYFFKAATATDWTVHVRAASTSTTAVTGLTLADDTYCLIGFSVVNGAVRWFALNDSANLLATMDGDPSLQLGGGTAIVNTNAPGLTTDLFLSVLAGVEGTAAMTGTVDWAFCVEWDS